MLRFRTRRESHELNDRLGRVYREGKEKFQAMRTLYGQSFLQRPEWKEFWNRYEQEVSDIMDRYPPSVGQCILVVDRSGSVIEAVRQF